MQGTVNSPILFNIFTHKICCLNIFNDRPDVYSLAFADDLVLLAAGRDPLCVESHLQDLVNAVDRHYRLWNLRVNPTKCEVIVFHKPLNTITINIQNKF
ncbi:unnamed protein product [Trichogramma brassicae]|uniref:Reverse transcriptase domain-containing protein n=1 Tax=Trichogramma brassicae TaxID=86971 RepID=A0A6H5IWE0_9HYME|nr:unnamed protein product [Trichogramma brassicae]